MSWRWTAFALAAIVVGALLGTLLALPTSTPAQAPPAQTAPSQAPSGPPTSSTQTKEVTLPPGYVGSETCKACHEELWTKFTTTKMGRIFLQHPRSAREGTGCEGCHGPGQAHAEAGGGKGVGGLITFAKNDKTPVAKRNEMCTSCHSTGPHLFWKGSAHESRDVACTGCHKVMENVSPKSQLARDSVIETC